MIVEFFEQKYSEKVLLKLNSAQFTKQECAPPPFPLYHPNV